MESKNCTTNLRITNNYFSFRFSKWFVILFCVALYVRKCRNQFFSSAISEVDLGVPYIRLTSYPGAEWQFLIHFTSLEKLLLCTIILKNLCCCSGYAFLGVKKSHTNLKYQSWEIEYGKNYNMNEYYRIN